MTTPRSASCPPTHTSSFELLAPLSAHSAAGMGPGAPIVGRSLASPSAPAVPSFPLPIDVAPAVLAVGDTGDDDGKGAKKRLAGVTSRLVFGFTSAAPASAPVGKNGDFTGGGADDDGEFRVLPTGGGEYLASAASDDFDVRLLGAGETTPAVVAVPCSTHLPQESSGCWGKGGGRQGGR